MKKDMLKRRVAQKFTTGQQAWLRASHSWQKNMRRLAQTKGASV
jgi:hypothetical protein